MSTSFGVNRGLSERCLAAARREWGSDWSPSRWASAPGRIELLGNHVDYNGGQVIAAAIDLRTLALYRPGGDHLEVLFVDLGDLSSQIVGPVDGDWRMPRPHHPIPLDYVKGAIAALGARLPGSSPSGQVVIAGDVPIGFGVSSSAALCLTLVGVLHPDDPVGEDLVLRAQEAEHRAGTPCGTMDQSSAAAGQVILYDASTMTFRRLQPDLGKLAFILIDSGVDRSLGQSSYPLRVRECAEVVEIARQAIAPPPDNLSQISLAQLEEISGLLSVTLYKRALHIISEVARVQEGVTALETHKWLRFGTLMDLSGESSANDYEISHPIVENLVTQARSTPGVLGTRMMGGGEGGAALALVEIDAIPDLERRLTGARRISTVKFGDGFFRSQ